MFKYRFFCTDKSDVLFRINQTIANDLPCGKTLWCSDLYKSGIHFQEYGDRINGFYLAEPENESQKGLPIRVCFSGKFVEEENNLFFDVYIYPRIIEVLFLIFAFILLSFFGKIMGFVISLVVLCLFGKGYIDMMKDTYNNFNEIFY